MTYGEEWRARARSGERLAKDEEKEWASDLAWEAEHPEMVERLEAFVGRKVGLVRDLLTIGGKRVFVGTVFYVRARARDRLIAWRPDWGALLFREEWIAFLPPPDLEFSEGVVDGEGVVEEKESESEPAQLDEDLASLVPPRWARRAAALLGPGFEEATSRGRRT